MKQALDWQELLIVNFQRYRNEIFIAVFALFMGLGVWEYQQSAAKAKNQQLSELYIKYQNLAQDGSIKDKKQIIEQMQVLAPNSTLTQLVKTQQAKLHLAKGQMPEALAIYDELTKSCTEPFCDLFQIRTALIYLNQKEPTQAIAHLNAVKSSAFKSYKAIFLGDALLLDGKKDQAVKTWEDAYRDLKINTMSDIEKGLKEQLAFRLQKAHS